MFLNLVKLSKQILNLLKFSEIFWNLLKFSLIISSFFFNFIKFY